MKKALLTTVLRRVVLISTALVSMSVALMAAPVHSVKALENGTYTGVPCDTSFIVWGRPECDSYFQGIRDNLQNNGVALFQNGEFLNVQDKDGLIQVVNDALFAKKNDDPQLTTSAAAIVNLMLGRPGTDFNSTPQGIQAARKDFQKWIDLVTYYDNNKLIRYAYVFAPSGEFENSGYSVQYNDLHTHRVTYSDTLLTIRFDVPPGGSGEAFMIDKYCGNLKGGGDFPKMPPNDYSFAGDTTVSGNDQASNGTYVTDKKLIYVTPGSTVTFNHALTNTGGTQGTAQYTASTVDPNGSVQNAPAKVSPPPRPNPGSIALGGGERQIVNDNTFTVPAAALPGQRYCQYISYQPLSSQNGGTGGGAVVQACVEVAYNYNLVPAASVSETLGTAGGTVTFGYNINNTGQTTSRVDTAWTIQQIVVSPGKSLPNNNGTFTDGGDCSNYVAPGITCQQLPGGGSQSFGPGNTSINADPGATTLTLNGYPAGTKVCRILTIDPPTQNANPSKRWSAPTCVTVGKYPTVHFMSGDISVGGAYPDASGTCTQRLNSGNIYTATNSNTSGSIDEYGAFARGTINFNGGSKKGFGTRSLTATDSQRISAWSLAFANTSTPPGKLGDIPNCMNDYYARYSPQAPATAAPNPVDLAAIGSGVVHYNGDIVIQASSIPAGKSLIVVVDGKVTITGNITYPANYGSLADIPSIAIVAKGDITINDNVTRTDGSFFSRGTFATCQTSNNLSVTICNTQLVVNGAVYTDKLQLSRTFGADGGSGSEPAERFIYGAELLYNNVLEPASNTSRVDVINEQDLPPRY